MQAEVLEQETPASSPSLELGVCTIVQLMPFHRSARVPPAPPEMANPTAQHRLADGQATPSSRSTESGLGLDTIDHAVPFQRSVKVWDIELPTAKQLPVPLHATLSSWASVLPDASGTDSSDQEVPFHFCAVGSVSPLAPSVNHPTARQVAGPGQATLVSRVAADPPGFGLDTTDHLVPFHRSARLPPVPWAGAR
jgi:hypothetical protein